MDKPIKKKNRILKKILLIGIPLVIIAAFTLHGLNRTNDLNLEKDNLLIKEVKKGQFEDFVLVEGRLAPKNAILLNVIEGGFVTEIYKENGQVVEKGTPLVRLYNPNTELNYLTQETAIIEQINNLLNIRINLKSQQLDLDEQLLSIENAFKNATRQFVIDTSLYNQEVIAKQAYEDSAQEYDYQKKRNAKIKTNVHKEKEDRIIQLKRINTSIENMEKSLDLLRKNKENFIIKAPTKGLLANFTPKMGANFSNGDHVGVIETLSGYKIVAEVDEFFISKLKTGARGTVLIEDKNYEIELNKIHPNVQDGRFEIELQFTNEVNIPNLKSGRSLKVKIFLSENSHALLLPKGMFFQTTNGKWVFVIKDNKIALRRDIKIGRENPFYYEILEGLEEGEKIITSDYEDYQDINQINFL